MKNILFALLATCITLQINAQASISATYTAGDIPTSFDNYDASCNGPNTMISITLPSIPGNYEIIGIDIEYEMTGTTGFMDEQRSQIYCPTTLTLEDQVYEGVGAEGTFNYNRNNVDIANGDYAAEDVIQFEMHAWRTWEGLPGCHTTINKVDDSTWTITVYYELCPPTAVMDKVLLSQSEIDAYVNLFGDCTGVAVGNLTIG